MSPILELQMLTPTASAPDLLTILASSVSSVCPGKFADDEFQTIEMN
jgi:hypothetical protein